MKVYGRMLVRLLEREIKNYRNIKRENNNIILKRI